MASKKSNGSLLPWLGIALIVILLDQITKAMIMRTMTFGSGRTITSFFNIVYWQNKGAAFSFLNAAAGWQRWLFIGLGVAAAVFIVWMLSRHGGQRVFGWALALILGGAIGNVIDRVWHGFVIDFIQVHWHEMAFPSFNVADSAITVGAILLIIDELSRVRRSK
jgi:signal peptidase II